PGTLARLGELARELGFQRTLLVSDEGLVQAGYVVAATRSLADQGIASVPFHGFGHDPDTDMVARGAALAREQKIDSLVGLGGGSSMDCAKGIDFVLTNGGTIADYRGYAKTT